MPRMPKHLPAIEQRTPMSQRKMLRYADAIVYTSLPMSHLEQMVASGLIKSAKVGKARLLDRESIDKVLDKASREPIIFDLKLPSKVRARFADKRGHDMNIKENALREQGGMKLDTREVIINPVQEKINRLSNFVYVCERNSFIHMPTNKKWTARSIKEVYGPAACKWIKRNRYVTSVTCDPSLPSGYVRGLLFAFGQIEVSFEDALYNSFKRSQEKSEVHHA